MYSPPDVSLQAINKISEAMQVLRLQHQETAAALANALPQHQQQMTQPHDTHQQREHYLLKPQDSLHCQTQQTELQQLQQQQQGDRHHWRWAIDIGACPGGWTTYLSDCCGCSVIAVDPAQLDPSVTARPGVYQIKGKAQDVGPQIDQLLQGQKVRHVLPCF